MCHLDDRHLPAGEHDRGCSVGCQFGQQNGHQRDGDDQDEPRNLVEKSELGTDPLCKPRLLESLSEGKPFGIMNSASAPPMAIFESVIEAF